MNRKIDGTAREFILARYRRDPHAFNAATEARQYDVSRQTIYNVIAAAGLRMRRGRKPLIPPESLIPPDPPVIPNRPKSSDSQMSRENMDLALGFLGVLDIAEPLTPLLPADPPDYRSLYPGKSEARRGPPAIHPPKPKKNSE